MLKLLRNVRRRARNRGSPVARLLGRPAGLVARLLPARPAGRVAASNRAGRNNNS